MSFLDEKPLMSYKGPRSSGASKIAANGRLIEQSNVTVIGDRNTIKGNNNTISGNHCKTIGSKCVIWGNSCDVECDNSTIIGDYNRIKGRSNKICGQGNVFSDKNDNAVVDRETLKNIQNPKPNAPPIKRPRYQDVKRKVDVASSSSDSDESSSDDEEEEEEIKKKKPKAQKKKAKPRKKQKVNDVQDVVHIAINGFNAVIPNDFGDAMPIINRIMGMGRQDNDGFPEYRPEDFEGGSQSKTMTPQKKTPRVPCPDEEEEPELEDDQLDSMPDEEKCKICYAKKVSTIILPCLHVCMCIACSRAISVTEDPKCPICKKQMNQVSKIFKS